MSVNAGNVVIAIQAIDEASGVFSKIQASLGLLGNTLQGLGPGFQQIGSILSGFAVGGPVGAAVAGIGDVVQGLQFSIDSAAKLQTVWTDLQSTLHLSGAAWDAAKAKIDTFVESLRTTTTFSDTQLIGAFQRLTTYGMSYTQAMDALKAATELAAAKHVDLETAATALGKAFQGNSMFLRRYGIEVATVSQETSLGTEAIKEMGVKLATVSGPQLQALSDAMKAAGLSISGTSGHVTTFMEAMTAAGLQVEDSNGKMLKHAVLLKEVETAMKDGGTHLTAFKDAMKTLGLQTEDASGKMLPAKDIVKEIQDAAKNGTPQIVALADAMTATATQTQSSTGKMIDHAAVLKEIETAWKGGTIDAAQLSAIVAALGITFQGNKALAMDYGAVLGQVNTQFGGAAQAQASTYAGLQERLGNAVQVLGEKIGSMLLPALSGILEALIPIVDGFSRGVAGIQNFVAAIAAIPAVKATTDAIGQAFAGLTKYFMDAWNSVSKDLGPALKELWGTLQDLWTALKPLFDAFGELMAAFGGSGDDINIVKLLLEALVLEIKGLAEFIRLIIPVVHAFAVGFKELADIITPPLKLIGDAVRVFLKDLSDAFQSFYDWLVGHSLWKDLWQGVYDIASGVGKALVGVLQGAFDLWKSVFTLGMDVIKTILTTGFSLAFATVQTIVAGATTVLKGIFQGFIDLLNTGQKTWNDLVTSVNTATATMRASVGDFLDWLLSTWKAQVSAVVQTTIDQLAVIVNAMTAAGLSMRSTWKTTLDALIAMEKAAFQEMVDDIKAQLNAIIAALQAAKNAVSGQSIWPEMLNDMVTQTKQGMAAIGREIVSGLGSPSGIIPTLQVAQSTIAAGAPGPTPSTPVAMQSQQFTIPISVYLDGQQIAGYLETRTVQKVMQNMRAKRAGKV